ncbi:MAG: choice-of-anchor L domain-containing protein, partial [Planctomycetes bacterium]|nr:choice-of-anchor L domain-containing protein [Planctomycetota bacterium]
FEVTDPGILPGQPAELQLQYLFGSDEYNEFVGSFFNDVFAIFVNGTNVALLPDGSTPVGINTLHCGNPYNPATSGSYCHLFNNNDLDDGGPFFDTEMDGFTDVMTARASVVGPGPHTIKLAIGDAGDSTSDSFLCLAAAGLRLRPSPTCIAPTPALELGAGVIGALVDAAVVTHEIRAVANVPNATVRIEDLQVTLTEPGQTPVVIPLPSGVVYDQSFPTLGGQPEVLHFSWSPTSAAHLVGRYDFRYRLVDSAGTRSQCTVAINVFECMMFLGTNPFYYPLGPDPDDILRVQPWDLRSMSLNELPTYSVPPLPGLIGFRFYVQGLLHNPSVFPNNPLSLSSSIEYTIGVGANYYDFGTIGHIQIFPAANGVVNPGETFQVPFTLIWP